MDRKQTRKRSNAGSKPKRSKINKPEKVELVGVVLSKADAAPQLSLSKDQLQVVGDKGFRMVRATHGVREGSWFWECEVLPPVGGTGHVRVGWAAKPAELQAPVGYDQWSFAYRDLCGSKLHKSLRVDGYGEAFGPGDVIGCAICLVQDTTTAGYSFHTGPSVGAVKGFPHEPPGDALSADPAHAAPRSHIRFFKNGVDQGVAFEILNRNFFPAVSVYMGGRVRVNFGPEWLCPPQVGAGPTAVPPEPASSGGGAVPASGAPAGPDKLRPIADLKPLTRQELAAHVADVRKRRQERTAAAPHDPPPTAPGATTNTPTGMPPATTPATTDAPGEGPSGLNAPPQPPPRPSPPPPPPPPPLPHQSVLSAQPTATAAVPLRTAPNDEQAAAPTSSTTNMEVDAPAS